VKFEASDLDSSNIDSLEYIYSTDKREWRMKQEGSLLVTFSGGQKYIYEDVAFIKVMAVISDESVGGAFNDLIKSNHKYTKFS
jgi:hypothetical protein